MFVLFVAVLLRRSVALVHEQGFNNFGDKPLINGWNTDCHLLI